jgi:hypothetical protein
MRTFILCALSGAAALGLSLALPPSAQAQAIYGGEFERARSNGTTVPYDGAPWSHRYNYATGSFFYLGPNARQLWYLEYLDRQDRAERFGYRPPTPPPPIRWGCPSGSFGGSVIIYSH